MYYEPERRIKRHGSIAVNYTEWIHIMDTYNVIVQIAKQSYLRNRKKKYEKD